MGDPVGSECRALLVVLARVPPLHEPGGFLCEFDLLVLIPLTQLPGVADVSESRTWAGLYLHSKKEDAGEERGHHDEHGWR